MFGHNIYEDYIVGLVNNADLDFLRIQFIKRILGSRTKFLAETLDLKLKKQYYNWDYPWNFRSKKNHIYSAYSNPDIVCHTSKEGVLISHINREFIWLEQALRQIKNFGYLPDKYSYITVLKLKYYDNRSYIVLDGNHRISALSALGYKRCKVRIFNKFFLNFRYRFLWITLLNQKYSIGDAEKVFLRYFRDTNPIINESHDFSSLIFDEPCMVDIAG
ncbi:hypothetical protein MASR1M90_00020 [Desulfovibrionales bacterium]